MLQLGGRLEQRQCFAARTSSKGSGRSRLMDISAYYRTLLLWRDKMGVLDLLQECSFFFDLGSASACAPTHTHSGSFYQSKGAKLIAS
jgi:hypothetical protein